MDVKHFNFSKVVLLYYEYHPVVQEASPLLLACSRVAALGAGRVALARPGTPFASCHFEYIHVHVILAKEKGWFIVRSPGGHWFLSQASMRAQREFKSHT